MQICKNEKTKEIQIYFCFGWFGGHMCSHRQKRHRLMLLMHIRKNDFVRITSNSVVWIISNWFISIWMSHCVIDIKLIHIEMGHSDPYWHDSYQLLRLIANLPRPWSSGCAPDWFVSVLIWISRCESDVQWSIWIRLTQFILIFDMNQFNVNRIHVIFKPTIWYESHIWMVIWNSIWMTSSFFYINTPLITIWIYSMCKLPIGLAIWIPLNKTWFKLERKLSLFFCYCLSVYCVLPLYFLLSFAN